MKKFLLAVVVVLVGAGSWAQSDNGTGAITVFTPTLFVDLSSAPCPTAVFNLQATTAPQTPAAGSGTMANDAWFQFVAPAEVVKIKVCAAGFDAAIEVWSQDGSGNPLLIMSSANSTGSGGSEFVCATGLIYNTTYKVRVGRVSGSGVAPFNMSIQYLGYSLQAGYSPGPAGTPCYNLTATCRRQITTLPLGTTRWKFVDEVGTTYVCDGGAVYNLSMCPGLCENHTYTVTCQVQAVEPECGNIWWGYSIERPLTTCSPCTHIQSPACNSTICNFGTAVFTAASLGAGYQYQFKFVTDGGATEFCTVWSTNSFFAVSASGYQDYFRYGKIYQIYVRVRFCEGGNEPVWCGPCTITTCPMPYFSVNSTYCCKWRNKSGSGSGPIGTSLVPGSAIDQYRFRFSQLADCPQTTLIPAGPAVTTGWSSSVTVYPSAVAVALGKIYNVQIQCRILPNTLTECDGTATSLPGQESDWGPPCLVGIRNATSPPVGSGIGCFCTPSAMLTSDDYEGAEFTIDYGTERQLGLMTTSTSSMDVISVDVSNANLTGNGILQIYNISGQMVYSKNLYQIENANYYVVETQSALPSGIYIVALQTDSGSLTNKIFLRGE